MKIKGFVTVLLLASFATPVMAASKRKEAEKACKSEGLEGNDLKDCIKQKLKTVRKKHK